MTHRHLLARQLRALRYALGPRYYSPGDPAIQTVDMAYSVYKLPHSQLKQPPIFQMHGLNGSRAHWRRINRQLAKRGSRPIIAVDVRNHGETPHSPDHTPRHMAADAAAFIKYHKIKRVLALGYGVGARALMTLALRNPGMVERGIFVDMTPGQLSKEITKMSIVFKTMLDVLPTIPKKSTLSEGRMFILPSFAKIMRSDLELILIMHNLKKTTSGFAWRTNPQAILDGWQDTLVDFEKTIEGLPPFVNETLLVVGTNTGYVSKDNVETMKKYFPNLSVEYLESDDRVHLDQPDKLIKLIVNFSKG
ncbi:hypothetical protein KR093_006776 [Drosophila rubida]|uniref:sn-1-specific diacylglycerol lipase ABHD11 n=1 Tax=Drosophila rubida TaxID=30044 RepID=A0AAD4PHY1_9MUSC|nr:hypothetical protein KR093_006776 [Drosophila rubida]